MSLKVDLRKVVTATMDGGDFGKHLAKFQAGTAEIIRTQMQQLVERFPVNPDGSGREVQEAMRTSLEHIRRVLTQHVEDLDEAILREHRRALKVQKAKHEMALETSRKASTVAVNNVLAVQERPQALSRLHGARCRSTSSPSCIGFTSA